jgi:hypothetical protein
MIRSMLVGDPNMITLYNWAFDYPILELLPTNLENDKEKLIDIVDIVQWCIGKEFTKDVILFNQQYERDPTDVERPHIHPPFMNYDAIRRQELLNCAKQHLHEIVKIDEAYLLNVSLRLWSGCLETAKTLSLMTQSSSNTNETRWSAFIEKKFGIDVVAARDLIYRIGEEIACLWQPDRDNICFDGVPEKSPARKYEGEWSKRDEKRQAKIFT